MLKKLFNSILALCLLSSAAMAQEFNCKVKIMRDKILNVDKEVFNNMERSIAEFLNTRKWTTEQYGPAEKIDCNILFNLVKVTDGDKFEGTLNIQSSRPVYNASYTSPTVNFIDREVRFKYSAFSPLQFDDNRVSGNDAMQSNLTAILAYYMYLILGLDYDSFELNGGTDFLKKAQNVVNNAPEEGKNIVGWKAVEGNRNRYWIVDQLLSPRFKFVREYWYTIHREALDNMFTKPEESRKLILEGLPKLAQVHKENPGSILMQFFFNAKSDEMASIVAQVPKEQRGIYISMLQQVDVPNAQKYNSLK
jgi:hypothetical protein